ncbi:hypothetical protein CNMCM5793_001645 [Aspergillus hiratsukae]|uniref:Survival Motor Neuron Gemin2-binding domain-containing protein n=1 Tax=Aspergillus hiratsukae TaxID=1194566 RepID=A0A8H6UKM8_9EURO|nr:hypothetical protein CNMCM5793_001645 [Aspergillus hiratsukae]KAF7156550.1 hypothetical protein CNMCM6106_000582 [Aspergillus hiratsukae]
MGKSKNANRPLTQEEIWDDSALVQSWDEAVEEYKLYHSIHAKGENVEDILRAAEAAESVAVDQDGEQHDGAVETMEDDVGEVPDAAEEPPAATDHQPSGTKRPTEPAPMGAAAMPHAALGQVKDEGLKNLMMAWYFAGYYTGLYEGQQRANQNNSS